MSGGTPWFRDSRIGMIFFAPATWQGYLLYVVFVAGLIASIPFRGRAVMVFRIVITLGFLAISYAKSYRE